MCVRVACRNKLTKLAGNRTERRQLNTELKGLVRVCTFCESQGGGSHQAGVTLGVAAGLCPAALHLAWHL
jgi:hypothetical protein